MKVYPKTDNLNENNCDFQLVHVGDDDESIHGATNFKKNTVNDLDQMSYESDTSKENSNHEDQHSDRSPEDHEDHEDQQQENLNDDEDEEEEEKEEKEEASVYSNNAHAVFENDRHSVFENDDEIIDGAYLANELTTLVNSWYNNFRRIPFNLRIVYILLFVVFTQLSFVEYRLYILSRQTEIHHQSSESFSNDLEVCRPSVPSVPTVPSVSRNGKHKNHGQHTRHQRSNGRHKKVHHRR